MPAPTGVQQKWASTSLTCTTIMTTDSGPALNFIIVGASVAGLASAIALKASRHNVLVLEKEFQLGGTGPVSSACARVPPNGSKILFDWGLEAQTRANSNIGAGFDCYKYDGGMAPGRDFVGVNRWNPELMAEARGDFVQFRHKDLLRILYEEAIKPSKRLQSHDKLPPRITVLFGEEVVSVDCDSSSVTMRSGEVHTGDAIIGADGVRGVVRRALLQEEDVDPESCDVPSGMALYGAVVPMALALKDPDLSAFYEYPQSTVGLGTGRGLITLVGGKDNDISVWVYTPDGEQDGSWTESADQKLVDILGPCDSQIKKLAALAGPATCVQIKEFHELESWVSESGRVLILGDAAHPFPAASLHTYSTTLEDAAFLGKIFSHTRNPERVPEFLYAFEEHRRDRCAQIREQDVAYMHVITVGDEQLEASMRANQAAGRNLMEGEESHLQQMLEDMRMVFGYDPADDADEWWMSWGRFRDSPKAPVEQYLNGNGNGHNGHQATSWANFSSVTSVEAQPE
ncbi:hypothetical protein B0H17DRAFT_1069457 [Mycena rosella]|uniref:FAD-binding domain-containing protein n=1 Tax=Mycena rosella TaxID=1033263 RepID=A0AAD7GH47_MYCRO|nr:hypothetical protein B0H17DRAFT_1069457 [Mycena rosella]